MKISRIKNLNAVPEDFALSDYITYVKTGATQDLILKIRNTENKEERTNLKKSLPAVIFGGVYQNNRKSESLVESTGLIGLDIDNVDISEMNIIRKTLQNDPFTHICNVSAGGKGFAIAIKYKKTLDFKGVFLALEKYFFEKYGFVLDTSCKDQNRLRFISYDPEIFYNEKSKVWDKIIKEENTSKHERIIFVKSDFEQIIAEIQRKNIDLSDDDYTRYRAIGFAISDEFGEQGRDYFHIVCQAGSKYKSSDCDKHYNNFCKAKGHGITLATFYHYCKEHDIKTYSEETKTIIKQATRVKKGGGSVEDVVEHLEKFNGIDSETSKTVAQKIFDSTFNFEKAVIKEEGKNDTQILKEYLTENYELKRNEVTRRLENKGVILTDTSINTIYIKTKIELGDTKVLRGDFDSIIFSDFTKNYNPIKIFIDQNLQGYEPQNSISRLGATFQTKSEVQASMNQIFVKKWYIGMVGMALNFGVSPLTLVLCGGQNSGKTEWFRRLLPDELKYLYAESKLDKEKDDEILMTQKILIMNDEFDGKTKADEKRYKEISSKNIFTIRSPYGRASEDLRRLATLGGTSNEETILNDPTGNRRILPIIAEKIFFDAYNSIDKDNLFLEAYFLLKEGYNYQLTREEIELLNDNTKQFETPDILEELFLRYFDNERNGNKIEMTNTDILLTIQERSQLKTGATMNSKRLGQVLKKLGYETIMKRVNGKVVRVYEVYEKITQNTNPYPHQKANW